MRMSRATSDLLPTLIHIQRSLGDDLSLEILADQASLSPFHFQRTFQGLVGETPKQYVQRLRLQSAAYLMKITDQSLLEIALQVGFQSHESFSRAFRRHFKLSPREYRDDFRRTYLARVSAAHESVSLDQVVSHPYKVQVRKLQSIHLIFVRNVGPYEAIPGPLSACDKLWPRLFQWAKDNRCSQDPLLIGIPLDDPSATPPANTRFDACLQVPRPASPDSRGLGYQCIEAGDYAVYEHVGPYSSLKQAYRELFMQARQLPKFEIKAATFFEVYRTTQINSDYQYHHTDIYLPLTPAIKSKR
jgi:AraC family transcriptional regulator